MAAKIVVPELGESVLEATVGRWLKQVGDPVAVGEPVVELETEKVDLEVGAEKGGVLARIDKQQGEDVKIGDLLGMIDDAGAQVAPGAPRVKASVAAEAKSNEPAVVSIESGREISRAVSDAPAPSPEPETAGVMATPSARRLALERGVDLGKVPGRDRSGRITVEDVEGYLKGQGKAVAGRAPAPAEAAEQAKPAPTLGAIQLGASELGGSNSPPGAEVGRREERVRMSRRRQTIARRLVEAQHAAAMLTTFNEVDMTAVAELRKRRKESFKQKHGVGLGIVSFFVKAVIGALGEFPELNAELQDEEIVLKHYYDIGIAVGASGGLVVPVLRDADAMSFAEMETAIKHFVDKAESGTLTLEDLRGGTFTITNGGVFGSLMSTPILNPPQVGILGLHKIQERPVSVQGQIVSRPMMYVALSYDHRIVDGREAVQFLVRVKELVEDPGSLLLEG